MSEFRQEANNTADSVRKALNDNAENANASVADVINLYLEQNDNSISSTRDLTEALVANGTLPELLVNKFGSNLTGAGIDLDGDGQVSGIAEAGIIVFDTDGDRRVSDEELRAGSGDPEARALALLLASMMDTTDGVDSVAISDIRNFVDPLANAPLSVRLARGLTTQDSALFNAIDSITNGEIDHMISQGDIDRFFDRAMSNPNGSEALLLSQSGLTTQDLEDWSNIFYEDAGRELRADGGQGLVTPTSLLEGSNYNAEDGSYITLNSDGFVSSTHYPNGSCRTFEYDATTGALSNMVYSDAAGTTIETSIQGSAVAADGTLFLRSEQGGMHVVTPDGITVEISATGQITSVQDLSGAELLESERAKHLERLFNDVFPVSQERVAEIDLDGNQQLSNSEIESSFGQQAERALFELLASPEERIARALSINGGELFTAIETANRGGDPDGLLGDGDLSAFIEKVENNPNGPEALLLKESGLTLQDLQWLKNSWDREDGRALRDAMNHDYVTLGSLQRATGYNAADESFVNIDESGRVERITYPDGTYRIFNYIENTSRIESTTVFRPGQDPITEAVSGSARVTEDGDMIVQTSTGISIRESDGSSIELDQLGNVVEVRLSDGRVISADAATELLGYSRVSVEASGARVCFSDDIPPRLVALMHPDGNQTTVEYDEQGSPVQVTLPNSVDLDFYDGSISAGPTVLTRGEDGVWFADGDESMFAFNLSIGESGSIILNSAPEYGREFSWTILANGTAVRASVDGVERVQFTNGTLLDGSYLYTADGEVLTSTASADAGGNVHYSVMDEETSDIMVITLGSDGWQTVERQIAIGDTLVHQVESIEYADGTSAHFSYSGGQLTEISYSPSMQRIQLQADGRWVGSDGTVYAAGPVITAEGRVVLSYRDESDPPNTYTIEYRNLDGSISSTTSIAQFQVETLQERAQALQTALNDRDEQAVFDIFENMSTIDRLLLDQEYFALTRKHIVTDLSNLWSVDLIRAESLLFHGRDGGANDVGQVAMALSLIERGFVERGERELRLTLSVMSSEQIQALAAEYYARYNVRLVDVITANSQMSDAVKSTVLVYLNGLDNNFVAGSDGSQAHLTDAAFNSLIEAAFYTDDAELALEIFSEAMTFASDSQRSSFIDNNGDQRMQAIFDGDELSMAREYANDGRISLVRLIDGNMATLHRNRDAVNFALLNASDEERELYRRGNDVIQQWRVVEGLSQAEIDARIAQIRNGESVSFPLSEGTEESILFYTDVRHALTEEAQADWEAPLWESLLLYPERDGGLIFQLRNLEESNLSVIDIGGNMLSGTHHDRNEVMQTIRFMPEEEWNRLKTDPEYREQFNEFIETWLEGDELREAQGILNELMSFQTYESLSSSRTPYEHAVYLSTIEASPTQILTAVAATLDSPEFQAIIVRIENGSASAADHQMMQELIDISVVAFGIPGGYYSYDDVAQSENPFLRPLFAPQEGELRLSDAVRMYIAETDVERFNVILSLSDSDKERLLRGMSDGATGPDAEFAQALLTEFSAEETDFVGNFLSNVPPRNVDIVRGFVLGLLPSDSSIVAERQPEQASITVATDEISAGVVEEEPITDIALILAPMSPNERAALFNDYAIAYGSEETTGVDVKLGVLDVIRQSYPDRLVEFQFLLATNEVESRQFFYDLLHQTIMSLDSGADDLMQGLGWDETTTQVQQELLDFVDALSAATAEGRELTQEELTELARDLDGALANYIQSKGEFTQAFIETVITIAVMAASLGTATTVSFVLSMGIGAGLFKVGASSYLMGNDYDGNIGRDFFTGFLSGSLNALGPDIFGPMPANMPLWRRIATEYMRNSMLGIGAGGTAGFFYGLMSWDPNKSFGENLDMVLNSTTLSATFGGGGAILFTTGLNGVKAIGYVTVAAGRQVFTAVRNMRIEWPSSDGSPPGTMDVEPGQEIPTSDLDGAHITDPTTGENLNPTHADTIPPRAFDSDGMHSLTDEPSIGEKSRLRDIYAAATPEAITAFANEARPQLRLLETTRQQWRAALAEFNQLRTGAWQVIQREFTVARTEILNLSFDANRHPELAEIFRLMRHSGEIKWDQNFENLLRRAGASSNDIANWKVVVGDYNINFARLNDLRATESQLFTEMHTIINKLVNDHNTAHGLPPVEVFIVDSSVVDGFGGDYHSGIIRINRNDLLEGGRLANLIFHENTHNAQEALIVWKLLSDLRADSGNTPTAAAIQTLWRSEVGTVPPSTDYIDSVLALRGGDSNNPLAINADIQMPSNLVTQVERIIDATANYVSPRASKIALEQTTQIVSAARTAIRSGNFDEFVASHQNLLTGNSAFDRDLFALSGSETLADIADPASNNWAHRLLELRDQLTNNPNSLTPEQIARELDSIMREAKPFVEGRYQEARRLYRSNPLEVDAYALGDWVGAEFSDPWRNSRVTDSSGNGHYHRDASGQIDDVVIEREHGRFGPQRFTLEDGVWYRNGDRRQPFNGTFALTPEGQLVVVVPRADRAVVILDGTSRPIHIDTADGRHFDIEYDPDDSSLIARITENARVYSGDGIFTTIDGATASYAPGAGDTVIKTNADGTVQTIDGTLEIFDGTPVVRHDNGISTVFRGLDGNVRRFEGPEGNYQITYENGQITRVVREELLRGFGDSITYSYDQATGVWTEQVGDGPAQSATVRVGDTTRPATGFGFDAQGRPVLELQTPSNDTLQFLADTDTLLTSVVRSDGLIFEQNDGLWSYSFGDEVGTIGGNLIIHEGMVFIAVETPDGMQYFDLFGNQV